MDATGNAPPIDLDRVRSIIAGARSAGQAHLLDPEARALVQALGIAVPKAVFLGDESDAPRAVDELPGRQVVVRVVATGLLHKTEVGGVSVVPREAEAIRRAMLAMRERLEGEPTMELVGWMVAEFVFHDTGPGGSLLVSARWTDEAGPVVGFGAGGVDAEVLAADLRPGREIAILSPTLTRRDEIPGILGAVTAGRLATMPQRGQPARLPPDRLVDVVECLLELAGSAIPSEGFELEINPLAVTRNGLVALDVLVAVGRGDRPAEPERPRWKLGRLLEPRSAAIIGVSAGMNAGHVILRNMLRDGFDPGVLTVVKPGLEELDGCRCVPDVASLPAKVDLFVVAVSAAQAADVVTQVVEHDAAEAIIVIPGGLEEKQGSEEIVARMRAALAASRATPGGGPLVNGGNSLGIRSLPGHYDTLFIPGSKLAPPTSGGAPLAIVGQSGAFAITRLSRLADLHPRYLIMAGNQMDLTVGDYLEHIAGDPEIAVYATYVEGFRSLDAARFLEAARRISERGGTVILYRAGRTEAGARASASHTASIAGEPVVVRDLARGANVIVADSLDAFDDIVRTATLLVGRRVAGRRLGAISNAGFECVAIGDNAGLLELPRFDPASARRLADLLSSQGAGDIVDVHNPLDATPLADDAGFFAMAETVIESPVVDVGIVGAVPLTAALQTLEPGPDHDEDLHRPEAIAARLVDLWRRTSKAWVVVVDGGPLYDPFVNALEAGGIPVFRGADRATRALEAVVAQRLRTG
jgi:acyl-CoA synthetase (NDP forming)